MERVSDRNHSGRPPARWWRDAGVALVALVLCLATPVHATEMSEAVAAYRSGDFARAHEGFLPLATAGDPRAQTILGIMYANGEGVPQDSTEAARWYRLAAQAGYASAQYNLGVLLERGEGVAQDRAAALRWYRLAADQGHVRARDALGDPAAPATKEAPLPVVRVVRVTEEPEAVLDSERLLRLSRDAAESLRGETPDTLPAEPARRPVPLALARRLDGDAPGGVYRIQLGAARTEGKALAALDALRDAHPVLLEGLENELLTTSRRKDGAIWFRMLMGPIEDEAGAETLCETLRARGAVPDCFVVERR